MQGAPRDISVELTFFPDRRASNPYQAVIYRALGPTVNARPGMIDRAEAQRARAGSSLAVFHLHWEEAVQTEARQSPERFLDALSRFRALGGRVVWTVHNIEPHDPALRPFARDLRPGLLDLADVVHVHSTHALTALAEGWGMIPRQARIIPHPSYDGCYPILDRMAARETLGLAAARMVVLAPGRIAAYKRTDALMLAFSQVAGADDVLLVAGALAKGHGIGASQDPRIRVVTEFAAPDQFARLHAACDLVVLPYAASLTSGSAILAATLGRGVLGADTPGLRDAVLPGISGVLYDAAGDAALADAMRSALAEGADVWAERGRQAARLARGRGPTIIASMWRDLLTALQATGADARRQETSA